jgi:hypothetical protein
MTSTPRIPCTGWNTPHPGLLLFPYTERMMAGSQVSGFHELDVSPAKIPRRPATGLRQHRKPFGSLSNQKKPRNLICGGV